VAYTPPDGGTISLDFGLAYTAPLGGSILLSFGIDAEVETPVLRTDGTRIPWGRLRRVDSGCRAAWLPYPHLACSVRLPLARAGIVPTADTRLPWQGTTPVHPDPTRAAWQPLAHHRQEIRLPWISLDPYGRACRVPWSKPAARNQAVRAPWFAGFLRKDHERRTGWAGFPPLDNRVVVPWINSLLARDPLHRTFWGRELYERICRRAYQRPDGGVIRLDLWQSLSQTDDGDHIHFRFDPFSYDIRCTQREPSGWRDNYIYIRPRGFPTAPKLRVYWMLNTALLTRVLDSAPIEVSSMQLAADIDSWCWSFTARVPEASLSLVMPLDEPVAVEAEINGHAWVMLVEGWSESHSFGRREYTIRGRSQTAMLAEPYAPSRAGSNTAATNARQLAEAELLYTGFTIDWDVVDWLVGAGALSYTGATPLKVIQQIAEAAGGRVISHRTDKQLHALPRLHSLPWSWAAATPDLGLSDYVVRQLSREFEPRPELNAVFVSGTNQGVLCKVLRTGTAGNLLGPMVTDALITAVEPARERGRLIIGQSGKWSRESLELPLTATPALPGLLEIGQLISMEERGQTWRGQVAGVRVSVDFTRGLRVSQQIDVERYRGD
jgi:hypothetical protein